MVQAAKQGPQHIQIIVSQKVEQEEAKQVIFPVFLKGCMLDKDFRKKWYFVFDTESMLVHFFKKENATNPKKTKPLRGIKIMTDRANSPVVMDRKTNQQRQTFRVQFFRSDGVTPKSLLYVVPQSQEEADIMRAAFLQGAQIKDEKLDNMVESIKMQKSKEKVEAQQALLPRKKGKVKRFFGALNPFKGSKKEKVKADVPYNSPREEQEKRQSDSGANDSVVLISEQELEQYEEEKRMIQQSILELNQLQKNDDPAVVEKFKNLLDYTSTPKHLNLEKRISQSLITSQNFEVQGTVADHSESSDESDEFMDCLETTLDESSNNQLMKSQKQIEAEKIAEQIIQKAKDFKPYTDLKDDFRVAGVHKDGGFPLDDPEVVGRYRRAGKSIISQIGRSVFSGTFNLGSVSFPIDCMSHKSMLYLIGTQALHAPLYLTAANFATDPVERMKYVIVLSLSFIHPVHMWDKPLNPILGETLQGQYADGSKVYMEQVTHHPPVSYFYFEGPGSAYRFYAHTSFSARPSMNSLNVKQEGKKVVEFGDGTVIEFTPLQDVFNNTLFGTMNHMCTGTMTFTDQKNNIHATYTIGGAGKKYAKDYFKGEIKANGEVVSRVFGSYMGYIDFDGKRYWDERRQTNYAFTTDAVKRLDSDWSFRIDSIRHQENRMEEAQQNKDLLENRQRADRKLREAAAKRRAAGGSKIDYSAYKEHPLNKNQ